VIKKRNWGRWLKTQSFLQKWRLAALLETGHAVLSNEIREKLRI
jgi:hypothetical protein